MALLFSDDFTAANGSAPNSTYFAYLSAGDIQGNRLAIPSGGGAFASNFLYIRDTYCPASFWLQFDVQFSTLANGGFFAQYRLSGTGDDELNIASGDIRIAGGASSTNISFTAADTLRYQFVVDGTSHWIKVWKVGDAEPGSPTLSATLGAPLSGNGEFVVDVKTGSGGTPHTVYLDNMFMYDAPFPGAGPSTPKQHPRRRTYQLRGR